jgi:transposase-like protein
MTKVTSIVKDFWSELEEVIREGGRQLIQSILEEEVNVWIDSMSTIKDERGRRLIKRNGYHKSRQILTGIGPMDVRQPRIRNHGNVKFNSNILPRYLRKVPSLNNLVPALYLKGISTGDFSEALESILGPDYKGFSAKSVERLKQQWSSEYRSWADRRMDGKRYVYVWADGIYFNIRLGDSNGKRMCFLVLIGALADGTKELVAVLDGYRESKLSWLHLIEDLKHRGLERQPELAVGDGALGFWAAVNEAWPDTKQQRCWVHKTANVLDKMPSSVQGTAKKCIHDIYQAETEEDAEKAWNLFLRLYEDKYPGACKCLKKDKESLFSFYSFPAIHWQHIRTTNVIESTFATIRHRSKKTKGCGSREATLTMVFKLGKEAEKHWRKLRGYRKLAEVIQGVDFINGYTEKEWEKRKLDSKAA